jgi:hypothetical protein
MTIVYERYGSQDTPTEWIVKDIVSDLKVHGDFWKRWNDVDHLERERERESE